jgi:hypothetical protein
MSGTFYQQVIILLTTPPGNLVYHLVLAFSIAGALPGAMNLWQRAGLEAGRRMVIGLGLLLLVQFLLIVDAGLAQFFPGLAVWLPILDRAANAISLVILIWLWVYPEHSPKADIASLLLCLLVLLLTVLTGLWWLDQTAFTFFNASFADLLWSGLSLALALAGGLLLLIRRPAGYGIGLGMFSLLFLGQLIYLFNPLPQGDYPGLVRLTQIAAYPLLLTIPARFSLANEIELNGSHGLDKHAFQYFQIIATSSDPLQVCQSITALVSHALNADLCLLISPPDINKNISLYCGYDLTHQQIIGAATFDSHLVPVLSESLRQARPLHLPAQGNIPDLDGFEKILNLPISGSLLSAPIFNRNGDLDQALVLFSLDSKRAWTAANQNYLADITQSLTVIYNYRHQYLAQADLLAQSNKTLQNIQDENDRLNDDIIEITAKYNASVDKINQLETELRKALQELDLITTTQTQEKGLPD